MRISNSLSADEVDLLEQVTKGLMRGQRDLTHLVRHAGFNSLAQKSLAMAERLRGTHVPRVAKYRTGDDHPKFLEALRKHPGASATVIAAEVGCSQSCASEKLGALVAAGKAERKGASNTTRYWPINASTAQPSAAPLRLVSR